MGQIHRNAQESQNFAVQNDSEIEHVPANSGNRADSALGVYLQQLRNYSLLDRAEEQLLAQKYVRTGDVAAAKRLMTGNLRLVVKIAREYGKSRDLADLIQEGNLGLAQAIKRYDPDRGVKLSTYAMWWIRAYVLKSILDNARLVRLGKTEAERKLFFNLKKVQEKLRVAGEEITAEAIAEQLNVPVNDVVNMDQRLRANDLSLDTPPSADDERSSPLKYLEADASLRPDEAIESSEYTQQLKGKLHQFGDTLAPRDRTIFNERWMQDEPKTLKEIGDQYGISRERARQIEKKLMGRLRTFLAPGDGPRPFGSC